MTIDESEVYYVSRHKGGWAVRRRGWYKPLHVYQNEHEARAHLSRIRAKYLAGDQAAPTDQPGDHRTS